MRNRIKLIDHIQIQKNHIRTLKKELTVFEDVSLEVTDLEIEIELVPFQDINPKTDYLDIEKGVNFDNKIHLFRDDYFYRFRFFSQDYSLANNFTILKQFSNCGGQHWPDGGYSTSSYYLYPQFYFTIKNKERDIPVLVQHEDFIDDKKIRLMGRTITTASRDYKEYEANISDFIDSNKALTYFKEKGVKDSLMIKLEEKIKEIKKYSF